MKKIISVFIMFIAIGLVSLNIGTAGTTHEGHGQSHTPAPTAKKNTGSTGTFTHEAVANHVRAEFKIMSLASMHMKDPNGATHHVMLNLYHDSTNHPIKDAVGKVKVIGPDGKEQINTLKNYNGIFAANFTFSKNSKYGAVCLVKVDGEKHVFKFWYPHG
ncbi:MAG: hypothetical protein H8D96_12555 [Desulfobacterales bacterium]|uniref:YtkA-like domain-containing protein n=1 Tax=Candidatus Desulfatibia vada TaxID=2841696 RepID=A0A8J6P5N5_9BACT|nr:hypothetical protein [Candidatus Desulfatibia vada]MBL6970694.1 hypothetical protein [Desulfobacterales bacterium]